MEKAYQCSRLAIFPTWSDLQEEILLQWQSALKWDLVEVQPASIPSNSTGDSAAPVQQIS